MMKQLLVNKEVMQAYLNGKTQTRRVILEDIYIHDNTIAFEGGTQCWSINDFIKQKAKYKKGDKVWLREPAKVTIAPIESNLVYGKYLADNKDFKIELPNRFAKPFFNKGDFRSTAKWINECQGIPNGCIKELLRANITITDVRVERLQDISDKDCMAEGIDEGSDYYSLCVNISQSNYENDLVDKSPEKTVFKKLWNSVAKKGQKWDDNPFVFVYESNECEVLK